MPSGYVGVDLASGPDETHVGWMTSGYTSDMGLVHADLSHVEERVLATLTRGRRARESGVQFEFPNDRDDALAAAAWAVRAAKPLVLAVSGPQVDNVFPFEEV